METLFISREATLKRRENTLMISVAGKTKPFPIEKLRHVVLLGETELNTRLLTLCGQYGVRLSVFDYYGYFKGAFEPIEQNQSGWVKLEQARWLLNEEQRMGVAREIVRGAEGKGHQVYYGAWGMVDERLQFGPRVRRPPNNPVNCLISFLNQLVYTVVRHETFKTHLEETFSFLHSPGRGRSSLSLDLAEPFKPVLSHQLIFKLVRKNIMAENWFDQKEGVCLLTETGRRNVAEQFSIRLEEEYEGRSFREWIYQEALKIERLVLGVAEYESFKRKA